MILKPKNENPEERIFIYEITPNKSMLFRLSPLPRTELKLKKIDIRERMAGGIIKTSLWESILDYNIHYHVLEQMEEALKWSVDFYHLAPGDKFKVIYEEKRAGGEVLGIGRLQAVYFKTNGKEHFAFRINDVEKPGFYDEAGRPVQKTFLKCPVKYERITSYYNPARLHPITKTVQPHFGTDFAAPPNSPIFAVADGAVEAATFNKFNGNYVKLRHDLTYETQYLHMVRIEDGIRPGVPVKQGQIIGYVGQTGLATGPHVCFRFWKNGAQVDPREEPENKPFLMSLKDQERFVERKNTLSQQLREIVYYDGRL
jgi:murein DD-endopeptidase MepM/ murein hydrolase activator NlpD